MLCLSVMSDAEGGHAPSMFVMAAVYILRLKSRSSFFQILLVPLLGAVLGVRFLIPFRRY